MARIVLKVQRSPKSAGSTSFPGSFISSPQRERGKKDPRLVTCLGNRFIFKGGVPIYQSIVAAAVCYFLNRLSRHQGKLSFNFAAKICHIKYIAFNI